MKRTLSPKKAKLLKMFAQGKPYKAIAAELDRSPKTIHNIMNTLRSDWDAANTTNLVYMAVKEGVI